MPNIILAKTMFDALKLDYATNKSRNVGHINLVEYMKKFGVTDEDIVAYHETLKSIVPVYSVCPVCGSEWWFGRHEEYRIKPISFGGIIDGVDGFENFCANDDNHGCLWYYQNRDGRCSFTLEVENLNGCYYDVRWNCGCAVQECYGKNVIYKRKSEFDYEVVCYIENFPFNVSREELQQIIEQAKEKKNE